MRQRGPCRRGARRLVVLYQSRQFWKGCLSMSLNDCTRVPCRWMRAACVTAVLALSACEQTVPPENLGTSSAPLVSQPATQTMAIYATHSLSVGPAAYVAGGDLGVKG